MPLSGEWQTGPGGTVGVVSSLRPRGVKGIHRYGVDCCPLSKHGAGKLTTQLTVTGYASPGSPNTQCHQVANVTQFPINQIQSPEQRQNIHTSHRPYHNYNSNCRQATSVDNSRVSILHRGVGHIQRRGNLAKRSNCDGLLEWQSMLQHTTFSWFRTVLWVVCEGNYLATYAYFGRKTSTIFGILISV